MKILIATILFLCLCAPCFARDLWMPTDTALQVTSTALMVADWAQTRDIAKSSSFYETNEYLGRRPSAHRVDTYFASAIALNAAIAYVLPQPWRGYFQMSTIVLEAGTVGNNYALGIKMRF